MLFVFVLHLSLLIICFIVGGITMAVSTLGCWGPGPGTARQGHAQSVLFYHNLIKMNYQCTLGMLRQNYHTTICHVRQNYHHMLEHTQAKVITTHQGKLSSTFSPHHIHCTYSGKHWSTTGTIIPHLGNILGKLLTPRQSNTGHIEQCTAPAQLFFIERGCLSKTEIGEQEKEKPACV